MKIKVPPIVAIIILIVPNSLLELMEATGADVSGYAGVVLVAKLQK
ncbi:3240_t:CDS:2 [Funneliformis mosseae]|uniref:3240_t:CDS:1 n=1 Tax=Funneliformis mosseae TaxID=27381 RepID=A0A9N9C857_FUNMO|nr:3240_t:CDS:2 [Funneliformis mosseae]